jgi:hypothetical protein
MENDWRDLSEKSQNGILNTLPIILNEVKDLRVVGYFFK